MVIRLPDGSSDRHRLPRGGAGARRRATCTSTPQGKPTRDSRVGPRAAGIPGVVPGPGARAPQVRHAAVARARRSRRSRWRATASSSTRSTPTNGQVTPQHGRLHRQGARSQRGAARGDAATLGPSARPTARPTRTGDVAAARSRAARSRRIAAGGADAFYRGPLARTLATRVAAMGGIWTAADLAGYKAIEREPIRFSYRGHDIITMPPPSAGGITLRQILAASRRPAPRAARLGRGRPHPPVRRGAAAHLRRQHAARSAIPASSTFR